MRELLTKLFITITLAMGTSRMACGEIVVHETFDDGDVSDNLPGNWSMVCFGACPTENLPVDFSVGGGEFRASFSGFAAFQLDSVEGQDLELGTQWSVRARFLKGRPDGSSEPSVLGVGLSEFYHATAWTSHEDGPNLAHLAVGQYFNTTDAIDDKFPFDVEQVIQLDSYSDRLVGHLWRVDDPASVVSATWVPADGVKESLPTFYGNFSTEASFREVIVATEAIGVGGDFNTDGHIDILDVDALLTAVKSGENDPRFNLSADVVVDTKDLGIWVHLIKNTYFGDANLDGEFNSSDFISVFGNGKYENGSEAGWGDGDWNGDSAFDSGDFIVAFQDGGYELGPRAITRAVPEPSNAILLWAGIVGAHGLCRIRRSRYCLRVDIVRYTNLPRRKSTTLVQNTINSA